MDVVCPVCGTPPQLIEAVGGRDAYYVECAACGHYAISGTLFAVLRSTKPQSAYILSAVLRRSTDLGQQPVELTTYNVDEYSSESRVPDVMDRLDLLLLEAVRRSPHVGEPVHFNPVTDYPVAFAKGPVEFKAMLDLVANELGYLAEHVRDRHRVTAVGWRRATALRSVAAGSGNHCFVAMSFADDLRSAFDQGFEPAIREAGYVPVRVDLVEHNDKICDRVVAEIRQSRLLVADFTGQRGGVYFEAGLAMGLGIPVIWTCKSDELGACHFDTRQYNHVDWTDPQDLRDKLLHRILATHPIKKVGVQQ